MPRYTYKCDHCKETFEVTHGMFFVQEQCTKCHVTGTLTKIPDFNVKLKAKQEATTRPGVVVDEYIRDAKKELKKQRKELKTEVYDK